MKPISCPKCQSIFEPVISESKFSCPNCNTTFKIFQKDGKNIARVVPTSIDEVESITDNRIHCPYCQEMIMENASICKHCGRNLFGSDEKTEFGRTKRNDKRIIWLVYVLLFLIVVIACLWGLEK